MFPLVHSNRHLLNGGVILRIYYIRVMRNIYKSSSRFKKEIASIDLFIFFFLSTGWKSGELLNSICFERNGWKRVAQPVARSRSLDGAGLVEHRRKGRGCALAGLKCESVPWIRPWYSCISQSTSNRPSTGWANSYTRSRFQSWPRYLDFFQPGPRYMLSLIIT